jgi:hypothetical protein
MTSILPHSRKPDVSFYSDGRIDITARIAKELNLQQGDVIDVVTSGWKYLLYVRLRAADTDGRHEAQVYRTKQNSNNFRTYSRTITDVILEEVSSHTSMLNGKIARLPAGKAVTLENYGKAVPIRIHNTL